MSEDGYIETDEWKRFFLLCSIRINSQGLVFVSPKGDSFINRWDGLYYDDLEYRQWCLSHSFIAKDKESYFIYRILESEKPMTPWRFVIYTFLGIKR